MKLTYQLAHAALRVLLLRGVFHYPIEDYRIQVRCPGVPLD